MKETARYKLCQLLMDHSDVNWIIDDKYWSKISFKKEYISRYLSDLPIYSSLRNSMQNSFKIGVFYTDTEVKKKVETALLDYENEIVKITPSDYIPVFSSFFDILKTSSMGRNGFKINSLKQTHSRIKVLHMTQDEINKHIRYWEGC